LPNLASHFKPFFFFFFFSFCSFILRLHRSESPGPGSTALWVFNFSLFFFHPPLSPAQSSLSALRSLSTSQIRSHSLFLLRRRCRLAAAFSLSSADVAAALPLSAASFSLFAAMLNGFHGSCRVTRETYRVVSCRSSDPFVLTGRIWVYLKRVTGHRRVDPLTRFASPIPRPKLNPWAFHLTGAMLKD
jgi:hypothetical protein